MGISSINDFSANAAGAAEAASNYQKTQLEDRLSAGYQNATAEELMDACKSFESYFVEQILKEVDKSTPLFGSNLEDTYATKMTDLYKDQMIQTMASKVADQTGNTLAMQLYKQMKRNYGITDEADEAKAAALQETQNVSQAGTSEGTQSVPPVEAEEEQAVAGVSLRGTETENDADESHFAGISLADEA
jgi:Rod binding domain-containing protein